MTERITTVLSNEEIVTKLRMLRESGVNISEIIEAAILDYKLLDDVA